MGKGFCFKFIITFVMIFSIFMNIFVGIFNNSDNNILADNAVLSRFFAVTDLTLNCVSDNLQYFNKVNENQKETPSDTFRYFNDLILSGNYNFSEQTISSTAFLFFISVACFMFIFCHVQFSL